MSSKDMVVDSMRVKARSRVEVFNQDAMRRQKIKVGEQSRNEAREQINVNQEMMALMTGLVSAEANSSAQVVPKGILPFYLEV